MCRVLNFAVTVICYDAIDLHMPRSVSVCTKQLMGVLATFLLLPRSVFVYTKQLMGVLTTDKFAFAKECFCMYQATDGRTGYRHFCSWAWSYDGSERCKSRSLLQAEEGTLDCGCLYNESCSLLQANMNYAACYKQRKGRKASAISTLSSIIPKCNRSTYQLSWERSH